MSIFGHPGELKIPPQAKDNRGAQEILRGWAWGDHQDFTIKHDFWDDPAGWGLLLGDVARHISRSFQERRHNQAEVYQRILDGFRIEAENPTDSPTGGN